MAKFQSGHAKVSGSGRKQGTPNKKTIELHQVLDKHGLDLIEQLSELLPKLNDEKRADILLELMSYIYPKRKAVEFSSVNESKSAGPLVILTMPRDGREAKPDD